MPSTLICREMNWSQLLHLLPTPVPPLLRGVRGDRTLPGWWAVPTQAYGKLINLTQALPTLHLPTPDSLNNSKTMINPQKQQPLSQSSEAGFTIMESLMAMLIITILMLGISPMIVLGVANRVQSRRVELAVQAARAYIDGVRSEAITFPEQTVTMDAENILTERNKLAETKAPKPSDLNNKCDKNSYCNNKKILYCVDLDEEAGCSKNSSRDLIIQAFRSIPAGNSSKPEKTYFLGVRVYRADAFKDNGDLSIGEKGAKAKAIGPGLSDRKAPLVEMTTEITTGTPDFGLFCQRLGGCE
ncbi:MULTISPECIES: hormogonium polysaccharide secretion pseudopilin HpsB [unclassified Moorena]|uniref:hormogonium polysaccharide secretion pseudopilin HpsB n=1 Tax=unclassified Moorena TaxID=2683338 RepID=UPI0025FDD038|nr:MULTISPECIES: hormogonium polysaccharide secretion pseudopilin HpsB [unclassified Moorena]